MKKLKKYWKLAVPFLAVLAAYLLVAAVLRAVSIVRAESSPGDNAIITERTWPALWLELKNIFMLSRY